MLAFDKDAVNGDEDDDVGGGGGGGVGVALDILLRRFIYNGLANVNHLCVISIVYNANKSPYYPQ